MNFKLIAAAFAAMGLAACSPSSNVAPQGSASPTESTVTPAPAQPAELVQLVEVDKPAADQPAASAATEEKKEVSAAPATEARAGEAEKAN